MFFDVTQILHSCCIAVCGLNSFPVNPPPAPIHPHPHPLPYLPALLLLFAIPHAFMSVVEAPVTISILVTILLFTQNINSTFQSFTS